MKFHDGLIKYLDKDEIFVFGSNLSGIHGKGAAKFALKFGAKRGIGVGLIGQTYAIPTKGYEIKTMELCHIAEYVEEFIECVKGYPHLTFYLTDVGCGLAGYKPKQIAPLFKNAIDLENIYFPPTFRGLL